MSRDSLSPRDAVVADLVARLRARNGDGRRRVVQPDALVYEAADVIEALVNSIRAVMTADEQLIDVAEYALDPDPGEISRAQRKLDRAWGAVRKAVNRATQTPAPTGEANKK